MSEQKHTPGPWAARAANDVAGFPGWHIHRADGAYRVALVQNVSESPANEANARLVAAAPELLELLSQAREFIDTVHDGEYGYSVCTRDELVEQLDSAIRKATGA